MKKVLTASVLILLLGLALYPEIIEKIEIEGNKKVSRDTVLFYMKSREKGLYSSTILKDDFNSLWKTGFFENIVIAAEDGAGGKIVKINLKENKLISSIKYKTGKKIKESDITDKLQENNIILTAYSYFSPAKIKKAERIIKNLLIDKGYSQGEVKITSEPEKDQIALTIQVDQGHKTKIGDIVFPGIKKNKDISTPFLIKAMKNNQRHSFLSMIGGKDVYNRDKIEEDLEEIKLSLQEKGYLEAKVGSPSFSTFKGRTFFGSVREMMRISIPVELGPRYTLGDVKVEGNKIVKTAYIKSMIKIKKGKVYNIKKRNKMIENLQKIYGSLGYIYAQISPVDNLDPVKQVADLTLRIHEGEVAYIGKLEFKGNTFTRDHVIRREWFLREGQRFNTNYLETSITRMKQLGLVTIEKMPEIKPDSKDPTKVNITAEVKELNRQMINFNVGYSGYDGWFVALGYSTQNFMGMGESLSLQLQSGTRAKQYQLSFTEPYLFNTANLGISVHKTSLDYPYLYTRRGEGFNLSTSFRFWRYFGTSLNYSFENVEISNVNEDLFYSSSYYYYYYYTEGKRSISALSPTIYYSTVDSPIFPSRGTKYLFNYRYSGGLLGGDVNMHRTKLQFVKFIPIGKHHTLGFQVVHEAITRFGEGSIPIYEKIFLGGERSIRGFDIYRIGPRNEYGSVIGGNKAFYLNLEYQMPLNEQISFVLFYDVGNSYDFGQPIKLNNVYSSMGLELKIFVPMLNVPFRLIFAYNPRVLEPEDSNFVFRFAVGPSFY